MGFFGGPKTLYNKKQIKFKKAKDSLAMKDLMSKEGVSKVLDKKEEVQEFYSRLKENASGGGVTQDTIKKTLGDFRQGRGNSLDKKEAAQLAQKLIPDHGFGTKKYIFTKEKNAHPEIDRVTILRKKFLKRRNSLNDNLKNNSETLKENNEAEANSSQNPNESTYFKKAA